MSRRILIAADHAGYLLKQRLLEFLEAKEVDVTDLGCYSEEPVDYPVYADAVAREIQADPLAVGILICGTGIGMSIAANKHFGVRAALCHDTYAAQKTREHNDSNILCLGARCLGYGLAEAIVLTWLQSSFGNADDHLRRLAMIGDLEAGVKH